MKKFWTLVIVALLVSCGGGVSKVEKTWNDVYAMIDSGEKQSVVDRTISELGFVNHPASGTVLKYFDYFMTGEGERAWEYVDPSSPFAKEVGNAKALQDRIEKAFKENSYRSVTIKGLSLAPKDANGNRFATVRFSITIDDKITLKTYDSIANYILRDVNGNWLIYDIIKPNTVLNNTK